eukprot:UN24968
MDLQKYIASKHVMRAVFTNYAFIHSSLLKIELFGNSKCSQMYCSEWELKWGPLVVLEKFVAHIPQYTKFSLNKRMCWTAQTARGGGN